MARAFTEIEKLVAADPAAAREALAGYLEPIALRVVDDGGEQVYEADVTLKRNMAALASGHVVDEASCGGLHQVWESPAPGPISFFMPRLRGGR